MAFYVLCLNIAEVKLFLRFNLPPLCTAVYPTSWTPFQPYLLLVWVYFWVDFNQTSNHYGGAECALD